jgi:hypothetical protein
MARSRTDPRPVKSTSFSIPCDERLRSLYGLLVKKARFRSAFLGRLVVDVRIYPKPSDETAPSRARSRSKKTAGARKKR